MLLSCDFETNGIQITSNTFRIISVALSYENGEDLFFKNTDQAFDIVKKFLDTDPKNKLLVYNISFEGAIFLKYGIVKDFSRLIDVWRIANYCNNEVNNRKTSLNASVQLLLGVPDFKKPFFDKMIELGYAKDDKEAHKKIAMLPDELLKEYNCLDTKYTLDLYKECIKLLTKWEYLDTARRDYINYSAEAFLYAVSYLRGLNIDKDLASKNIEELKSEIPEFERAVKENPDVLKYEALLNKDLKITDADVRKVFKKRGESVTIKKGTGESLLTEEERKEVLAGKWVYFNPNSSKQKVELFIDMLGYPILNVTEGGAPSISKNVLRDYGELGKALQEILKREKEVAEIEKLLELSKEDGLIHLTLRSGATISGRSSSKTT